MQTRLTDLVKKTPEGIEAEEILRSCVHCGFCLATCPTYQLLGNELDSPRGRIYLIKQLLEGEPITQKTQLHLDRCLTCRACETTCPSGVRYGHLLDIGRGKIEQQIKRPPYTRLVRYALRKLLPNRALFEFFLRLARFGRPLLPARLKRTIPTQSNPKTSLLPSKTHLRTMLALEGCVQPALSPTTHHAAVRVLDKLGISLLTAKQAGCCGALAYHLNAQEEGLHAMRRNIDAWWPYIAQTDSPVEAIVMTASGCGVTVKEYGHLLRHDPVYAEKAARIADLARDISEVVATGMATLTACLETNKSFQSRRIAFHSPCTLQHGMRLNGVVEHILTTTGFRLTHVPDSHLCCGSAGTYSILQPKLSRQLRENKLAALTKDNPELLVTANIGCQMHLQSGAQLPVRHWIEILDEALCCQTKGCSTTYG